MKKSLFSLIKKLVTILAEILPGKGLGRVSSFGASRLFSTHRRRKPTILSI